MRIDSKITCRLHSINIRPEEQKFPAIFTLLALNHLLHFIAAVLPAGILHSIRCDDEQRMLRHILRSSIFMHISDMVNCASDHVTIDGFTSYEPGEYILNDFITPFYSLIFLYFIFFIRSFFVLCVVYSLIFL